MTFVATLPMIFLVLAVVLFLMSGFRVGDGGVKPPPIWFHLGWAAVIIAVLCGWHVVVLGGTPS